MGGLESPQMCGNGAGDVETFIFIKFTCGKKHLTLKSQRLFWPLRARRGEKYVCMRREHSKCTTLGRMVFLENC